MPAEKILEKDVEGYLRDEAHARGWHIRKNVSDPVKGGTPGFPDDTITMRFPYSVNVECKSPKTIGPYLKKRARFEQDGDTTGCSKTEIRQFREQQKLEDLDHPVYIVGTFEEVDDLMAILEMTYE